MRRGRRFGEKPLADPENMAPVACQWYRLDTAPLMPRGRWVDRGINDREKLGGPDLLPSQLST